MLFAGEGRSIQAERYVPATLDAYVTLKNLHQTTLPDPSKPLNPILKRRCNFCLVLAWSKRAPNPMTTERKHTPEQRSELIERFLDGATLKELCAYSEATWGIRIGISGINHWHEYKQARKTRKQRRRDEAQDTLDGSLQQTVNALASHMRAIETEIAGLYVALKDCNKGNKQYLAISGVLRKLDMSYCEYLKQYKDIMQIGVAGERDVEAPQAKPEKENIIADLLKELRSKDIAEEEEHPTEPELN